MCVVAMATGMVGRQACHGGQLVFGRCLLHYLPPVATGGTPIPGCALPSPPA